MFGTLQDRLVKELKLAGIRDIATANVWIQEVYLPAHNRRFAKPAALADRAFVAVSDKAQLTEALVIEEERIVARDSTFRSGKLKLQIPESRVRAHYVKARVKVREYPDATLGVFHGPRCIARYDAEGRPLAAPTAASLAPCSPPSRRGLARQATAAPAARRPSLTTSAREATGTPRVGTKKRALRSKPRNWTGRGDRGTLILHNRTREVPRLPPDRPSTPKRTTDVLQKPDIFKSY